MAIAHAVFNQDLDALRCGLALLWDLCELEKSEKELEKAAIAIGRALAPLDQELKLWFYEAVVLIQSGAD